MELIGDIGGTASRLALALAGRLVESSLWTAPEALADDLPAMLAAFRADRAPQSAPRAVALAGAGALRGDTLPLTNRALVLRPGVIRAALGNPELPVRLVNDMVGQGHGLAQVPPCALRLLAGPENGDGARLVVNIGTGLNACPVHCVSGRPFVPVAEAGNVTLPQTGPLLRQLAEARGGEVVAEDVISGRALPWLAQKLCDIDAVGAAALALPPVRAALAQALAAYLRDMVLTHMATGGVVLTGSVAAALADCLDWAGLHAAMVGTRAYTDLLASVPMHLSTDPQITLRGAAVLAAAL